MRVRVKVLCGQCGQLLCRIIDADDGRTFYRAPYGGGADTFSPQLVFCAEHGWPDLSDADLLADLIRSRAENEVRTHRARVSTARPVKPVE